jgi:TorA maturation chaperone TorD
MEKESGSTKHPAWYRPYAKIRTDCYVLLAALMNRPPSPELLELLRNLRWNKDIPQRMQETLTDLIKTCTDSPTTVINDEFNRLFVGLGQGELIPYGSWYLEKMIQSRPLAAIRSDLRKLSIVRQSNTGEPEDHVGALCEIMALITQEQKDITSEEQAHFFDHHIFPWMQDFFSDLQSVQNALFYPAVGKFGSCFLAAEREYLQNSPNYLYDFTEGGMQNDSTIF